MKKYTLTAAKREEVGRKVKNLRKTGKTPATVYGKDVKSVSVAVGTDEFLKVFSQAGETGLIELAIGDETRPVLIHTVQKDPVRGNLLHVEFYQVNLKQKVKTHVPLEFVGEAPAVALKVGALLTLHDEVEVEALPTDLPEKITLDISGLTEIDQELKVSDLKIPAGVTILTDSSVTVVRVGSLVSKEAEAQAAAEAAAAAAAAAATAPAEGTPAEVQPAAPAPPAPTEEKK